MLSDIHECWFVFRGDQLLLIQEQDNKTLLTPETLPLLKSSLVRQHRFGRFNHIDCYCAELDARFVLPANLILIPLRKAFEILGPDWYVAAAKAYSIINWDKNHQYCGRCGNSTTHQPGVFERVCKTCGLTFYPRISPSMIVLIKKSDHILMARSPHFPKGAYGLVAGFIEVGESIEDAVHREVKEEVGIQIKNLQYFGSQSWPFPDSLMIGFIADYDSGELVIDHQEIEDANWYPYDQLPGRPSSNVSIASKLIDHFIAERIAAESNIERK